MLRTLFALRGIGDSGKTTTISLVYNHFRQEGATVIYGGDYARRRQKGATEIKGAVLEIDGVRIVEVPEIAAQRVRFSGGFCRQIFLAIFYSSGESRMSRCRGGSFFLRLLEVDSHMGESFQFTSQFEPILGADRRDEFFLRLPPGWQAARERVLSFGRNGQKTLPHGGAIRNDDESLFLQRPQTPRQCRAVNGEHVREVSDGNRLVLRDAH